MIGNVSRLNVIQYRNARLGIAAAFMPLTRFWIDFFINMCYIILQQTILEDRGMSRPKKMITGHDAERAALERETFKDWHVVTRLSAVIAYAAHPAKEVAKIFNVTQATVINWAHAFHTNGVNGLFDAGKGHRKRKLFGKNAETVKNWVVTSKNAKGKRVHWTLKTLCIEIKKELGIDLAYSSLAETLAEMNLVIKRPHPMNYECDSEKAEDIKKKPRK